MNEIKITAPIVKALTEVEAGNVTFSYRSAPKIKGTRLVKAMSSEWLNKKIAQGVTNAMLAKLFDAELVKGNRSTYGIYGVSLTAKGLDALGAARVPVPADGPVLKAELVGIDQATEVLENTVEVTDAWLAEQEAALAARTAIVEELLKASAAAKTEAAQIALAHAAGHVDINELAEARKLLTPLRTRAALKAISAIKAL